MHLYQKLPAMRFFFTVLLAAGLLPALAFAQSDSNRQWFLVDSYLAGGDHAIDTLHYLSLPSEAAFALLWQGDTIAREWTCSSGLNVVSPLGALGMPNTFLLAICCGDGCPVMYKILSIREDKSYFLSDMLGNCNDLENFNIKWPYAKLTFPGTNEPHRKQVAYLYHIAEQHLGKKDTSRAYTISIEKGVFVARDKQQKFLYQVFMYDNGPDYTAEGLFRIVQDGKIGYADAKTGEVVIAPRYPCAWPFEGGKARVSTDCTTRQDGEHGIWESDNWFYINKKGEEVK